MFRRIVLSALLGGLLAGLALTGLQMLQVVPIILQAESYEADGVEADHGAAAHENSAHDHGSQEHGTRGEGFLRNLRDALTGFHGLHAEWAPEDGAERTAYTALANVLIAIGFGLLLAAAYSLRRRGVGFAQGMLWGLAGYAVFFALPAIGLPPELPGDLAAPLVDRQGWWLLTVICSGAGLALILLRKDWAWKIIGALLMAVPHLVGAPHPEVMGGNAPRELTEVFVWATAFANAVFWIVLGALTAFSFKKLGSRNNTA